MAKLIHLSVIALIYSLIMLSLPVELQAYEKASPDLLSYDLKAGDDKNLSPFTGWTREHWIEVAGKMAVGFVQQMDSESGLPMGIYEVLPDPPHQRTGNAVDRDEEMRKAFGRGMMIVAAYTAATGSSRFPDYQQDLVEPFLKTVIRATDPESPGYWEVTGTHSTVGSTIVISMLLSPKFFWEPLTRKQKENIGQWFKLLSQRKAWDNNHYYFHMTPASFLDSTGVEFDREFHDRNFQRVLGFYRGDGWYIDGDNQGFDYYNSWGFHLYNMIMYNSDTCWREKYGEIIAGHAQEFLSHWPLFFGADGAPVAWGRSLHYRFACLAPLAWAQINGVNRLDPGLSRRLASGVMKYFWENGCMSPSGIVEPGYLGRNFAQPEPYGGRGQAIWSSVGLAILAIPADNPFWTATEKPLPVEISSGVEVLRGPKMVLKRNAETGECRLFKAGSQFDHYDKYQRNAKYFGHAYSSALGFIVTGEGGFKLTANASAVSADGENWSFRDNPTDLDFNENEVVSRYDIKKEITGGEGYVITNTYIGEFGEVHVIYHTAEKPLYIRIGGYGIQVPHGEKAAQVNDTDQVTVGSSSMKSTIKILGGVDGTLSVQEVQPREGFENSHLFGGSSAFPYWTSNKPIPRCQAIVLYVNGARGELPAEPVKAAVTADNEQLELDFNGRHTFLTVRSNYWAPK